MSTYLHSPDSSIEGVEDVGAKQFTAAALKRDPSKAQFVQAARRQVKRVVDDPKKDWKMASTAYNPWGVELENSIKLKPQAIYESTPVRIDGLDNGSSIFVQAGDLIDVGFTRDEILSGDIHWDDVEQLIADRELDYDYVM